MKPVEWMPHKMLVAIVPPPGPPLAIKEVLQLSISGDDNPPPTWVAGANRLGPGGVIAQEQIGTFITLQDAKFAAEAHALLWYDNHESELARRDRS